MSTSDDRMATPEDYGNLEFEPWQRMFEDWEPKNVQDWAEISGHHLLALHIAFLTMHKSKPKLVEMMANLDEQTGHDLMDAFINCKAFLEGMLKMMDAAEVRLLSAGYNAMLEEHGRKH